MRRKLRTWFARVLYARTLALLIILFSLSAAALTWSLSRFSRQLINSAALEGTSLYSDALAEVRTFYTSDVVERVRPKGISVTHDYLTKAGAIPLPATFSLELGKRIGAHGTGFEARLYSDYPFPWRKAGGGPRDDFERLALEALRNSPEKPFYRFEDRDGRRVLRYGTADLMRPSCIACHNTHPDSPKKDWKEGDVRGVLEVIRPVDVLVSQSQTQLRTIITVACGVGLAAVLGLALVFARLQGVSAELDRRVRERTTELEASNRELDSFCYSVSHDLRAPLRHIDGFLMLLEKSMASGPGDTSRRYMETIASSARKMGTLIDELLAFSRQTRTGLHKTSVRLDALVAEAREDLSGEAKGRDVEWRTTALPEVEGDPALLRLVFTNLLANALKYTRLREKALIEVGRGPDRKGQAVIFVRDNGAGFDMRYADKLFGVFQRLHRQDEFEGVGIGLAIVRRIVERHGGRTWAEGQVGKGAAFYISLPLARKETNHG